MAQLLVLGRNRIEWYLKMYYMLRSHNVYMGSFG